ncbi:prohibitin family protein [Rhizobium lemnae]|uniref:Prohibitin family protein n=1 Tax=Rhizobium lemnae TaxID=1214924 RepID=A0ABV8EBY8_9HYPH|nr:prohibitin family protein [Rhizobium lemnae]MCJ8510664.1 prohibitin family protein [Rhizobium lemnae]
MKTLLIRVIRRISLTITFLLLIAGFLLVILWDLMVHTVPVGYAGVHWHRINLFGSNTSTGPLGEGLHVIAPWDKIYLYDLRLQSVQADYQVLSRDGLAFNVEINIRWRIAPENVVSLNQNIGPDYESKLIGREVGSVARAVIAQYNAEAFLTGAREVVQQAVYDRVTQNSLTTGIGPSTLSSAQSGNVVMLTDILIRNVQLPEQIATAIQNKLEQAQIAEEYQYRVEREVLESKRKQVEAEGIRRFQEIVTPAISESYLRWRGIEATLKLAESPNSKVVVIGNSATGLPLILDTTTKDDNPVGKVDETVFGGDTPTTSLDGGPAGNEPVAVSSDRPASAVRGTTDDRGASSPSTALPVSPGFSGAFGVSR